MVATAAGRIGVVVCYDLEFPEWALLPALEDADVLCVPTAWPQPVSAVPPGERSLEILRAQAAAAAGCCFVVVADRCGTERGARWQGASMVVGPDGYPVTRPPHAGPGVIVADCDLAAAGAARHAPAGHVLADRRIAPALAPGRIVDLSVVLDEHTQVFPGDPEPVIRPATTIAEQGFNVLHVAMGSQTGTHVDAPYHVREDGLRIDL